MHGRLQLGLAEVLRAAEQLATALEVCEAGLTALQGMGPDYLWGLLAAESAIALARLGRKSEAEARLAAALSRAGTDPCLAERLTESGRPRRAAFALDAARHDGTLTGNYRAMITALLRGGSYLQERGETDQGRKLLTQAVEAGTRHGYDDLAADALALLGQEAEAQAFRLHAAAETVKASLPGLSLRLELVGSADGGVSPCRPLNLMRPPRRGKSHRRRLHWDRSRRGNPRQEA